MTNLKVRILFKNIFLEILTIKDNCNITKAIESLGIEKKNVELSCIDIINNHEYQLNIKEDIFEILEEKLIIKFSPKSKKIIKYLDVIFYIGELNFSGTADNYAKIDRNIVVINYAEKISQRIYLMSKVFLKELMQKNEFVCYFFLRDIIEDIKLYVFFVVGSEDKTNEEHRNDINNKLENEGNDWDYDFLKLIKCNDLFKSLTVKFKKILEYNNICNNYIHKNGFSKFSPNVYNSASNINLLDAWYDTIKIFLIIVACFDGKSIASKDFIDYMDTGLETPVDCQYHIAQVFQDFINTELSKEEIKIIKEQSYMIIE